jgi:phosphomannomutase
VNDRQVYDADTPHQADPSEIEHMQQLIDTVKTKSLHCGFAFDSDADRVLAIDEKGGYINGSLYAGALVDVMSILNCKLDAVGYAVEIGPAFYNTVADLNISVDKKIKISPIPVGRSIVRQLVREDSVDLGIENVGHFYIYDFFRTDSGAFALLMMLYWMSLNGKLSKLYTRHPDGQRAQGSVPLSDENETKIHTLVNEIKNHFATNEVRLIDVDGVRLEIYNGGKMQSWCAVRKSGYEKKEKYYFGSTDPSDFEYLTEQFNLFANSSRSA